jgi:hypothetical protein
VKTQDCVSPSQNNEPPFPVILITHFPLGFQRFGEDMFSIRKLNIVVLFAAGAIGAAYADNVVLKANLGPSSEVPPQTSHGHGALNATYDTSSKVLKWNATYDALSGPTTAAHFHGSAPVGQNAGVQISIPKNKLASPIDGSANLSDQQAADLMAGKWYFNIHTAKAPSGEIRGQILPAN